MATLPRRVTRATRCRCPARAVGDRLHRRDRRGAADGVPGRDEQAAGGWQAERPAQQPGTGEGHGDQAARAKVQQRRPQALQPEQYHGDAQRPVAGERRPGLQHAPCSPRFTSSAPSTTATVDGFSAGTTWLTP